MIFLSLRLAGICEKRVKQDQRKVENILASNQQSEVENDFREFFDSNREDARDIIQSLYESEEEIDVHVYYPRIACTIFEVCLIKKKQKKTKRNETKQKQKNASDTVS